MSDCTGRADDTLEHDRSAGTITAGRTGRQQAIAAIIAQAVIENGIDYGAGSSDAVSVHSETIGYQIIDALREHVAAVASLVAAAGRTGRPLN